MKFFLDTANVKEIREAASLGILKSFSVCVPESGIADPTSPVWGGVDPASTIYINADKKMPPWPAKDWPSDNIIITSNVDTIMKVLQKAGAEGTPIKRIIIDTINGIMVDREMLEDSKFTRDNWMDLAKDIYKLIVQCNSLKKDLLVYLMGHVTIYTSIDGRESKCLVTNGRKLEKIKLESKLPIVLFTSVNQQAEGSNKFFFETQKNRSTGKTPPRGRCCGCG